MNRRLCVAALAALASLALAPVALADSRLFSVRADQPDITIDHATLDGQALSVAGKGGGVTFFRIDNPGGAVACKAHLAFTASNGVHHEGDVDLCASNWELTISVAAAATPPPAPPPPAPPPAVVAVTPPPAALTPPAVAPTPPPPPPPGPVLTPVPRSTIAANPPPPAPPPPPKPPVTAPATTGDVAHVVTISTDGPGVTISEVFLDHQTLDINSRGPNSVKVAVKAGAAGVQCKRDLSVKLNDGRSISRQVNICANNWSVVLSLADAVTPRVVTAPPPGTPQPRVVTVPTPGTPPPASVVTVTPPSSSAAVPPSGMVTIAPPVPSPPPAPAPVMPAPPAVAAVPSDAGIWMFNAAPGMASLTFGVPDSDATEFTATCQNASSQATIAIDRPMPGLRQGAVVRVTLSAGAFSATYGGAGSAFSEMTGGSQPEFVVLASDPLWAALISEAQLTIAVGSEPPYMLSLKGSAGPARQFLAACAPNLPPPSIALTPPADIPDAPVPPAAVSLAGVPPVAPPPVAMAPGVAPGMAPGVPAAVGRNVHFVCGDGSTLSVVFDRSGATVMVSEPGAAVEVLPLAAAGPDSQTWAAGPYRLVGKGERIAWWRPDYPRRSCRPG